MISLNRSKALGLVLATAGILLQAHNAFAADVPGDAQMQARDLLSGTGRSTAAKVVDAKSADGAHALNAEPQDQARQIILGKPSGDRVAGRVTDSDLEMTSVGRVRSAETDPQESARRMLQARGV